MQIRQLTRLGKGRVTALEYSPDGNTLAVGTSIGVVLYDTQTWSETLIETDDRVLTLAFTPDGNTLAVGTADGKIQLLQAPDWSAAQTFLFNPVEPLTVEKKYWRGFYTGLEIRKNVGEIVSALAFSPDGKVLVAGGDGRQAATGKLTGTVNFWRVTDGEFLNTIAVDGSVYDLAFHPDGRSVAVAAWDVTEWPVPEGKELGQLAPRLTYAPTHGGFPLKILFTPDGKSLVGWSWNRVIRWKTTGGLVSKSPEISGWSPAWDLSTDGKTFAIAAQEFDRPGSLEIWDLESGKKHPLQTEHAEWIRNLVIAPNGSILAAALDDGSIRIIDMQSSAPLQVLDGFPSSVDGTHLKSNGLELLSLNTYWGPDLLKVWDIVTGTDQETINLTSYGITSESEIAFSPDGSRMAVGNKNLQIWDLANKKVIQTLAGDQENYYSNIRDVVFSPDGESIAYTFDFGGVRLATISGDVTGSLEETISPDKICVSDDGRILITGVQFWDMETGKLLKTITGPYGRWSFYTPNCDMVASMSVDGHFRVMRNTVGKLGERVGDFDLRKEGIYLMPPAAFSPDRSLVAVHEPVGKIRIFSLETMKTLAILEGHTEEITGLNFSPDGKYLVSSSRDGTIRFWGIHP